MNGNLKALLAALDRDEELQRAYRSAIEGVGEADRASATVAFANEHGYQLSLEDLETADGAGLQEDELSAVVGGFQFDCKGNYLGPYPNAPRTPVRPPQR